MARSLLDGRAEALHEKLILIGALILAGCETTTTPTYPTMLESSASTSVSAASSVQAQQTTFSFCPVVTPFMATVGVVVVAGDVNLFVTSITSQFTDQNHVQLPAVTLPAPVQTAQFGSALVEARSAATLTVWRALTPPLMRFSTALRSAATMSRTSSGNVTVGSQPRMVRAL